MRVTYGYGPDGELVGAKLPQVGGSEAAVSASSFEADSKS